MTTGNTAALTKIIKAGYGHQGYCKLCSFADPKIQDEFDKRVLVYSPAKLNDWMKTKVVDHKKINRQTIYAHRKHVQAPEERVVQAAERRNKMHGTQPMTSSNGEFIDAVISLGHQNAMLDPDSVTIDQALKAVQIKNQTSKKGSAELTLIAIMTNHYKDGEIIVEGEIIE